MPTTYSEIYQYWSKNPCQGGDDDFPFYYFKNKKVLEIGCGAGVDAVRFTNADALYTGIDLTDIAVSLTKKKIKNKGIVITMNAESLDFPDDYFDLIYSHGVIHHTITPQKVIEEIYRVLKPHGLFCLMIYNKLSCRYLLDIMFFRKILWILRFKKYAEIRKQIPHPTTEQWISINSDTLGCPQTKVYTKKAALTLVNKFNNPITFTKNFGWFRKIIAVK